VPAYGVSCRGRHRLRQSATFHDRPHRRPAVAGGNHHRIIGLNGHLQRIDFLDNTGTLSALATGMPRLRPLVAGRINHQRCIAVHFVTGMFETDTTELDGEILVYQQTPS
jgi:hypothetical protein